MYSRFHNRRPILLYLRLDISMLPVSHNSVMEILLYREALQLFSIPSVE